MNVSEILTPEYLRQVKAFLEQPAAWGDPAGGIMLEVEIAAWNGRRVPLEVNLRLVLRNGKPLEVQGIARGRGQIGQGPLPQCLRFFLGYLPILPGLSRKWRRILAPTFRGMLLTRIDRSALYSWAMRHQGYCRC